MRETWTLRSHHGSGLGDFILTHGLNCGYGKKQLISMMFSTLFAPIRSEWLQVACTLVE